MRYSWMPIVFVLFATLTSAAPPVDDATERRDLEWRLYERVEFPLRVRQLDNEIKIAEARLKSLEKLLVEYQSFQKFSIGNPLTLTVEDTKLQIMAVKLRLEEAREERRLLDKYKDEQRRLFDLRAKAATDAAIIRARVKVDP